MSQEINQSTCMSGKEMSTKYCLREDEEELETVAENLSIMLQKEQTMYCRRSCDYLLGIRQDQQAVQIEEVTPPTSMTMINEADRAELVDWCYKVVDLFKFDREVVAKAMDMVDRFLSKSKSCDLAYKILHDRIQFQLLTVTALYISIKINEEIVIGSELFSIISCDLYSISDIEDMELSLLCGLSWYISAPTTLQIASHILKLISSHITIQLRRQTWAAILDEVLYQAEHAVRDYFFVTQRPSTVAIAAILNAINLVEEAHDHQALSTSLLVFIEGVSSSNSLTGGSDYYGGEAVYAEEYHRHIQASKRRLNFLVNGHIESSSTSSSEKEGDDNDDVLNAE